MEWILVVFESAEMAIAVQACLQGTLPCRYVAVHNLQDARKALRKHPLDACRLMVSSLAPPASADAPVPVDRGVATAVDFLAELRDGGIDPPCVFIDPAPGSAQHELIAGMAHVQLLAVNDMLAYLPVQAARLAAHEPPHDAGETHLLDVDIALSGTICNWHLSGKNGVGIAESGSIKLDSAMLDRLVIDSLLARATRSDAQELTRKLILRLGRDLYRCFAADANSNGLWEAVSMYTNRMRMLEKTRFRFQVDSVTSQLLLEALTREDADAPDSENYWMLRTPIVRRFGAQADRSPLFKDRQSRETPVECLVILGNPARFAASGALGRSYPAIGQASDEVDWLEDYLASNRLAFGLARPRVMRHGDYGPGEFGPAVRKALATGHWQLIHYTGHSDIGADGTGYLVLGDAVGDLLPIDEFARAATHAQFIFLNSCNSADARFIQRSVERNIPAVAGYGWPIRDDIATAFSRSFYENLFGQREAPSRRFLEYAFMRARGHLHGTYRNEAVWSAPLLFLQSMACEPAGRGLADARPS